MYWGVSLSDLLYMHVRTSTYWYYDPRELVVYSALIPLIPFFLTFAVRLNDWTYLCLRIWMHLDASGALVGDEFVILGKCVWAKGPLGPKLKLLLFLRPQSAELRVGTTCRTIKGWKAWIKQHGAITWYIHNIYNIYNIYKYNIYNI